MREFCKAFLLLSEPDAELSQEGIWKNTEGRGLSLGCGTADLVSNVE